MTPTHVHGHVVQEISDPTLIIAAPVSPRGGRIGVTVESVTLNNY